MGYFLVTVTFTGVEAMNISEIQEQLGKANIDGWLLYDFQGLNPIARKLVGVERKLLTRRWFYWIPQTGSPVVLCHWIEQEGFTKVEGRCQVFKNWEEMHSGLQQLLEGAGVLAMEYSRQCSIPYISRIDAGTVELVKGLGKEVVSSADLVQFFEARWSGEQFQLHLEASRRLMQILFDSFREVGRAVRTRQPISEFGLQQAIWEKYGKCGLTSSAPPIVAVDSNTGIPHYEPHKEKSSPIRSGDLLLIDLWAKMERPCAVYADYTWVAYLGSEIPDRYVAVWEIVKESRDAALRFVQDAWSRRVDIRGWEVDKVAREVIISRGYRESFVHRTGHSIGEEDHGNGANMDDLETKDERLLIPQTCFSIEPGVYLPEFGIRSEVNVFLGDEKVFVTGDPVQTEIFKI
jgi:Xaa-Pro aminopeptidase